MHVTKGEAVWKSTHCDSNCMTFWDRRNPGDSGRVSGCRGAGAGGMARSSTEGPGLDGPGPSGRPERPERGHVRGWAEAGRGRGGKNGAHSSSGLRASGPGRAPGGAGTPCPGRLP